MGEIEVRSLCTLLCELCTELGVDPQQIDTAHQLVQLCVLARLLGAAPDDSSGRVKLTEVAGLVETAALIGPLAAKTVDQLPDLSTGVRCPKLMQFGWQLAMLRLSILQQV
jgi:hypothetical protein